MTSGQWNRGSGDYFVSILATGPDEGNFAFAAAAASAAVKARW
jgi:hypothetical protein